MRIKSAESQDAEAVRRLVRDRTEPFAGGGTTVYMSKPLASAS
jgi:hypothetical protein